MLRELEIVSRVNPSPMSATMILSGLGWSSKQIYLDSCRQSPGVRVRWRLPQDRAESARDFGKKSLIAPKVLMSAPCQKSSRCFSLTQVRTLSR